MCNSNSVNSDTIKRKQRRRLILMLVFIAITISALTCGKFMVNMVVDLLDAAHTPRKPSLSPNIIWSDIETRKKKGAIRDIIYTPDGSKLLVSTDNGIECLQASDGQLLKIIGSEFKDSSLAISPDGKYLVSGATIWSVSNLKFLKSIRLDTWPDQIIFSADSRVMGGYRVWMGGSNLMIIQIPEGNIVSSFNSPDDMFTSMLKFTDDNRMLIVRDDRLKALWCRDCSIISDVDSPVLDNSIIFGTDGRLTKLKTSGKLSTVQIDNERSDAVYSPDHRLLASIDPDGVYITTINGEKVKNTDRTGFRIQKGGFFTRQPRHRG